MATEITLRIEALIRSIPAGRVSSYSAIAAAAGIPNGARQVARLLHSRAASQNLPWQRVVKKDGSIALPKGGGFEIQRAILLEEGVAVSPAGRIDLGSFGWQWDRPRARTGKSPATRRA